MLPIKRDSESKIINAILCTGILNKEPILKALDEFRASQDHVRDIARGSADGYEVDIKVRMVNIPDVVRKKLGEETINNEYEELASQYVQEIKEELKRKYKWIGEVGQTGRSGGWITFTDDEAIYSTLEEGRFDEEDENDYIKKAEKLLSDLQDIKKEIEKEVKNFKKQVSSKEFWKEIEKSGHKI